VGIEAAQFQETAPIAGGTESEMVAWTTSACITGA
jgi:hypothetical protein